MTNERTQHDGDRQKTFDILLVEDNPGDVRLACKAFDKAPGDYRVHVANTGKEALAFLRRSTRASARESVNLVLLDLKLPDCKGTEVLAQIKNDPALMRTPVIILTSSDAEDDIIRAYDNHANAYLTKPTTFASLVEVVEGLTRFWLSQAKIAPNPHSQARP